MIGVRGGRSSRGPSGVWIPNDFGLQPSGISVRVSARRRGPLCTGCRRRGLALFAGRLCFWGSLRDNGGLPRWRSKLRRRAWQTVNYRAFWPTVRPFIARTSKLGTRFSFSGPRIGGASRNGEDPHASLILMRWESACDTGVRPSGRREIACTNERMKRWRVTRKAPRASDSAVTGDIPRFRIHRAREIFRRNLGGH